MSKDKPVKAKDIDWDEECEKENVFATALNSLSTEQLSAEYLMCNVLMTESSQVTIQRAARQKILFMELTKRARQESIVVNGVL